MEGSVFLGVNGVRLHALVFGDGPRTLVAIAGWTSVGKAWEKPIGLLTAAGWRCIAYDYRGSGESLADLAFISACFCPSRRRFSLGEFSGE